MRQTFDAFPLSLSGLCHFLMSLTRSGWHPQWQNPRFPRTDALQVSPKLGMKLDRLKRLMLDLALTLKVHPIALGIKGEPSGQIHIPKHVRLESSLITNVSHYNDREKFPER